MTAAFAGDGKTSLIQLGKIRAIVSLKVYNSYNNNIRFRGDCCCSWWRKSLPSSIGHSLRNISETKMTEPDFDSRN